MFYETLQKLCTAKKTTVYEVLKTAGIRQSVATGWRRGSSPNLTTVNKLAAVLGVKPSKLVPDIEEEK